MVGGGNGVTLLIRAGVGQGRAGGLWRWGRGSVERMFFVVVVVVVFSLYLRTAGWADFSFLIAAKQFVDC